MNTKIDGSVKYKSYSPNSFLMKVLYEPISWRDGEKKRRKKVNTSNFEIPEYKEYDKIRVINYNVTQLKSICRYYKQKISGNKDQLIFRMYNYLKFSYFATIIQKSYRGYLVTKLIRLKGPAYMNRECNNTQDFMTLDKLKEIPQSQFFSYTDSDGFIYGFDISSLYNLYKDRDCKNINPYNRKAFPKYIKKNMKQIIRLSLILKQNITTEIEIDESKDKEIEFLTIKLFQILDSFGHITDIDWFLSLSRNGLIRYIRELYDIWCYRAQLSNEKKHEICPPYGKPFGTELVSAIHNRTFEYLQKYCLGVMIKLVTLGEDVENRKIGGIYVLGALTIVNNSAATAFPWLFHSFAQNL